MELGPRVIFTIGSVKVTETVIFAWIVSAVIILFAILATRRMSRIPKGLQAVGELIVETVYKMTRETMGNKGEKFAPYMGTLFLFLAIGSALGLLDLRPITADLNCTAPLAVITFFMIHVNAVRARTGIGYVKHLSSPYAFMLPMNILSDIMFPITLACRIFGNITAGVIIMTLFYGALESLSTMVGSAVPFFQILFPLPLNAFFDMFEPFLQAYVFTMLTMVFTANGMDTDEE